MVKSPLWRQSGLVSADERVWIEPGSSGVETVGRPTRREAAGVPGPRAGCIPMRSLLIPARIAFCLVHAPSGAAEPSGQDAVSESPPPRAGRILGWFRKPGSRPGASTEVPAQPPGESSYLPYSAPPPSAASPPAPRASEARPAPSRSASVDPPVRRVQAAPGEVQPTPFTPGVLQPGAGGALMSETVPSVGGQSVSLQAALYGALTSNPDLATSGWGIPRPPRPRPSRWPAISPPPSTPPSGATSGPSP